MEKVQRKFRVIALSVGGRGNKIYNSGDEVLASNFPDGNADELVTKGFLKEIGEGEGTVSGTDAGEGQPEVGKAPIAKVGMKKLKSDLTAAKITYNPDASKEELYELWSKIE